jgi:hypothetical protein
MPDYSEKRSLLSKTPVCTFGIIANINGLSDIIKILKNDLKKLQTEYNDNKEETNADVESVQELDDHHPYIISILSLHFVICRKSMFDVNME